MGQENEAAFYLKLTVKVYDKVKKTVDYVIKFSKYNVNRNNIK